MSSTYCTQSNIEDHYGTDNIETWAKLASDYTASQITARITRAIAWAGARMDAYLRVSGMTIPVVDEDGSTPTEIEDVAATLAGWWLYKSRGVDDVNRNGSPRNKLQFDYDDAMEFLRDIRDGKVRIDSRDHTG